MTEKDWVFYKKILSIKYHIKDATEGLKWRGKRPDKKIRLCRAKENKSSEILDVMMTYVTDRIIEGDVCRLPRKDTFMFVGFNSPTAIERMRKREDYPYKPGIIPGFIKVSKNDGEYSYVSLLMPKPMRLRLIDKLNSGKEYFQPIPLHTTYDSRKRPEEKAAWRRLMAEKKELEECNTLTWTI